MFGQISVLLQLLSLKDCLNLPGWFEKSFHRGQRDLLQLKQDPLLITVLIVTGQFHICPWSGLKPLHSGQSFYLTPAHLCLLKEQAGLQSNWKPAWLFELPSWSGPFMAQSQTLQLPVLTKPTESFSLWALPAHSMQYWSSPEGRAGLRI